MANITGTNDMDNLAGTDEADVILALGGNDFLVGRKGNDTLDGGEGADFAVYTTAGGGVRIDLATGKVTGGAGSDTLVDIENIDGSMRNDVIRLDDGINFANGNGGNDEIDGRGGGDTLFGGTGDDAIRGGQGDDTINAQEGDDLVAGGLGQDTMSGESGTDTLSYADVDVAVEVRLDAGTATGAGIDHAFDLFENVEGSGKGDTIWGDAGDNSLFGQGGNDVIRGGAGDDAMYGGAGNDELWGSGAGESDLFVGGAGKDVFHGFGGAGTFRFERASDSPSGAGRDRIVDFFASEGDRIDLAAIDAKAGQGGNQAFTFIGTAGFSAAGQVRYVDQPGGAVLVQASTDGDAATEFEVEIGVAGGGGVLNAGDFML